MSTVRATTGQESRIHHPTEICEIIFAPIHYTSEKEMEAVQTRRRSEDEREAVYGLLDLSLGPRHWSALRAHQLASQFYPTYIGVRPMVFHPVFDHFLTTRSIYYFALTDPCGRVVCVLKSDYGGTRPSHSSYMLAENY